LLAKDDELASHLSRNNALHEYKETQEEVLIIILKAIRQKYSSSPPETALQEAKLELQTRMDAVENNSRLQRVMNQKTLCLLLSLVLLPLGPHFRRRREFSVAWLYKSIDVCMGVSELYCDRDIYIV